VAGVTTLGLLACAAGLTQLDVGQTLIRGLPPDADARRAYAAASQGFAPGVLSPTVVLVEAEASRAGARRWPACRP
jgi:RND superfamily putative drug exporter